MKPTCVAFPPPPLASVEICPGVVQEQSVGNEVIVPDEMMDIRRLIDEVNKDVTALMDNLVQKAASECAMACVKHVLIARRGMERQAGVPAQTYPPSSHSEKAVPQHPGMVETVEQVCKLLPQFQHRNSGSFQNSGPNSGSYPFLTPRLPDDTHSAFAGVLQPFTPRCDTEHPVGPQGKSNISRPTLPSLSSRAVPPAAHIGDAGESDICVPNVPAHPLRPNLGAAEHCYSSASSSVAESSAALQRPGIGNDDEASEPTCSDRAAGASSIVAPRPLGSLPLGNEIGSYEQRVRALLESPKPDVAKDLSTVDAVRESPTVRSLVHHQPPQYDGIADVVQAIVQQESLLHRQPDMQPMGQARLRSLMARKALLEASEPASSDKQQVQFEEMQLQGASSSPTATVAAQAGSADGISLSTTPEADSIFMALLMTRHEQHMEAVLQCAPPEMPASFDGAGIKNLVRGDRQQICNMQQAMDAALRCVAPETPASFDGSSTNNLVFARQTSNSLAPIDRLNATTEDKVHTPKLSYQERWPLHAASVREPPDEFIDAPGVVECRRRDV